MDTLMPGRAATVTSWVAQVVAAAILGQTLFFKFSGATESRYIFTALGAEPWGRYGTGVLELVAVALLLIPRTAALGAVLAAGLMAGALLAHVTRLGIEVQGDHGLLFGLALTVFIASLVVLTLRRRELPIIGALL
jgi:uncharacterized membrane protein YphA (DoxX/SURF4 family)